MSTPQRRPHFQRPSPEGTVGWASPWAVFIVTLAAMLPAIDNDFVNFDDPTNFLENLNFRGLGPAQIKWCLVGSFGHMGNYEPLTWLYSALTYRLWGLDPSGYHLQSVLLHAATAVVFYFVAKRLLGAASSRSGSPGGGAFCLSAALAALMFSVHPLRVEAVAWASGQHYVLAGLLFMTSIWAYLRAGDAASTPSARGRWLAASLLAYGLSLSAFAVGVFSPAAFLILDVYPLRRLSGRPREWLKAPQRGVLLQKAPYFALGLASTALTLLARGMNADMFGAGGPGVAARAGQAVYGLAFYLAKTLVPSRLAPFHDLPLDFKTMAPLLALSAAAALALAAVLISGRRRWPAAAAAAAFYLVALVPVLGFAQYTRSIVADRYSYFPCLGWPLAAAGAWLAAYHRAPRSSLVLAAAAVACLFALTRGQVKRWRDSESLWRRVLQVEPDSRVAHTSLAAALYAEGNLGGAVGHFREALRIDPGYGIAYDDLGVALWALGRKEEAIEAYRAALRLDPSPTAYINLAAALVREGRTQEAADDLRAALRLQPDSREARDGLALIGRMESKRPGKRRKDR